MAPAPAPRVADRLARAAATALVGREAERRRLAALLDDPEVVAVFVHGAGGIGKSALVSAVLDEPGRRAVVLPGRDVAPTASGFLTALGAVLGADTTLGNADEAGAALLAHGATALVVDGFERLHLLDGWLRNELALALPDGVTLVLVTRQGPNVAWRSAPGWRPLLAELPVGPLADEEAQELLRRRGVDPGAARRIAAFAGGHPLALELAAAAERRHPGISVDGQGAPDVVEELYSVLLDDLAPVERSLVERASVLRRLTLPALAAVVEDDPALDAEGAWQLLQGLPFTRRVPGGLVLEPVARAVVADAVELRDPRAVRATRGRVARRLVQEPGPLDWGTTADLLHLVQNPVIRHAYEPAAGVQHPVERATPADSDELLGIVAEHQGPAARRVVEQWWAAAPWAFAVARGESAQVRALSITAMLDEVPSELASGDPVVVACHAYARRRPPAAGTRTLLFRTALGRERGEQPGVELATMVVELKRHYFEHRHELGRVLTDVGTWDEQADALRTMGFEPVGPVRLGGRSSTLAVLEFGSGGVEGWLARHVLAESGAGRPRGAGPAAARDAPPAPPPGPVARLSPRELEVLLQLAEGRTNRELADALFISERTANRHVSNIFQKLGVRNRTAAARAAVAAGLVR